MYVYEQIIECRHSSGYTRQFIGRFINPLHCLRLLALWQSGQEYVYVPVCSNRYSYDELQKFDTQDHINDMSHLAKGVYL